MKIDPHSLPVSQTGVPSTAPDRASQSQRSAETRRIENAYGSGAERARSQESGSTDRVQLSSLSAEVAALAPESSERAARVEELTKLVESGRYHVNSRAVSRAIMHEATKP
jgi:flagellar biosynthesis anti-sigma factor FlgM